MSIAVRAVSKRFGKFAAVDRVSLEVPSGALVALLGPSGSGKTTLLRLVAGLETPDEGAIWLHDEDAADRNVAERNIGFVFQHYALFRHMTVYENIGFALRVRRRPKAEIRERVDELLRLIQLDGMERRYPSQLSGGQRQRVALARALAAKPAILLLDEPFGALDARVRKELRGWLRRLHDEIHVTSVFVTHDQEEALELADHVVVMNRGRIEQHGTPDEVYHRPANAFVMDFLGNVNVFHARVHDGKAVIGNLEFDYPAYADEKPLPATVYVRPHELDIERCRNGQPGLAAYVIHVNPAGSTTKVRLFASEYGMTVDVELSLERCVELKIKPGDEVFVCPRRVRVFVPDYSV